MPSRVSKLRFRPSYCGVALLELVDDAQALQVVLEAAVVACMHSSSASWPAWPKGVWPRSCASAIASTRSSLSRSARAIERPSCATSSECVSRVRNRSPSWLRKTCVL